VSLPNTLKNRMADGGRNKKYPRPNMALDRALDSFTRLHSKRDAIMNNPDLSEGGKRKALRDVAAEIVDAVEQQRRAVARGTADLDKRRAELRVKPSDKSNVADALLHIILGQRLGELSQGEQAAEISGPNADPRILSAALELPRLLTRLSPDLRAHAERDYLERHHAPQIAAIDDEREAWDLAQEAVKAASNALFEIGGFSSPIEYDNFVNATAKPDEAKLKAELDEAHKLQGEGLLNQILELPLSQRIALGGELLNKNTADIR